MTRNDFRFACKGVLPSIITEHYFMGADHATFGVRHIATWFPDGEARVYTSDDDYETCNDAKELEDTLRWFIDHTPEEYFNDEDYVLDTTDFINAHNN